MSIRSLGFATDLALLRFSGSTVTDRGDCLRIETPDNPSFWWGNFLLLPTIPDESDIDTWIARHATEFPGAEHVTLGVDVPAGTTDDLAAFAARGFDVAALTVMTAQQTHPPRSQHQDAEYRPLAGDADWAQSLRLTMRVNYPDDTGYQEDFSRRRAASYRALIDAGHGTWLGAFLGDQLVAQLGLFATGDGLARFQSVETDPDFRRQGLAGGLVDHASRFGFDGLGAHTLVMVAEPDYVAIDLYRAVGFADTETQLEIARRPTPEETR